MSVKKKSTVMVDSEADVEVAAEDDVVLYKRAIKSLRRDLEVVTRRKKRIPCSWKVRGLGRRSSDADVSIEVVDDCEELFFTIEVYRGSDGIEIAKKNMGTICSSIASVLCEAGLSEADYVVQADKRGKNGRFIIRVGVDCRGSFI